MQEELERARCQVPHPLGEEYLERVKAFLAAQKAQLAWVPTNMCIKLGEIDN